METVIKVVAFLALHWQLRVVTAQDVNTQCEKSFNTNYGQVSNQDFANVTCSQLKIHVNGMEPLLLLCPYFNLRVGEQEYCMTISWIDRSRNFTETLQNTKKKKKKKKNSKNTNKNQKNRKKGKKKGGKDKTAGARKKKGKKSGNRATKKKQRRDRKAKRNANVRKKKQKKREKPWEENIRLPRALRKKRDKMTNRRGNNKTQKRPPVTKKVRPKTKKIKRNKTISVGSEMQSFVVSYCGTDKPYGLNAFDGIVHMDIVPSPNINRQADITDTSGNTPIDGGELTANNNGSDGSASFNNDLSASLGMQATAQQQIAEPGIHPDIVFQCFWSPSAP